MQPDATARNLVQPDSPMRKTNPIAPNRTRNAPFCTTGPNVQNEPNSPIRVAERRERSGRLAKAQNEPNSPTPQRNPCVEEALR
jgi:hypothetical protein